MYRSLSSLVILIVITSCAPVSDAKTQRVDGVNITLNKIEVSALDDAFEAKTYYIPSSDSYVGANVVDGEIVITPFDENWRSRQKHLLAREAQTQCKEKGFEGEIDILPITYDCTSLQNVVLPEVPEFEFVTSYEGITIRLNIGETKTYFLERDRYVEAQIDNEIPVARIVSFEVAESDIEWAKSECAETGDPEVYKAPLTYDCPRMLGLAAIEFDLVEDVNGTTIRLHMRIEKTYYIWSTGQVLRFVLEPNGTIVFIEKQNLPVSADQARTQCEYGQNTEIEMNGVTYDCESQK